MNAYILKRDSIYVILDVFTLKVKMQEDEMHFHHLMLLFPKKRGGLHKQKYVPFIERVIIYECNKWLARSQGENFEKLPLITPKASVHPKKVMLYDAYAIGKALYINSSSCKTRC